MEYELKVDLKLPPEQFEIVYKVWSHKFGKDTWLTLDGWDQMAEELLAAAEKHKEEAAAHRAAYSVIARRVSEARSEVPKSLGGHGEKGTL